jgi:hypothetical protein
VLITYHEAQEELRPELNWFSFEPNNFSLEPGKVQPVSIKLNLPVRTAPGKYFAYLEAQPEAAESKEGTSIGVAAAAKLYFTVIPGGLVQGIYYKAVSIWQTYAPWSATLSGGLLFALAVIIIRKYVNVSFSVAKKGDEPKDNTDNE